MGFLNSAGLAHFWAGLRAALEGKQDRLSGAAGQLVGFDALGAAAAVEADFVTTQQLDAAIDAAVAGAMEDGY